MVYNYTRPRGPIAAMYSSPGPCYALPSLVGFPNHDPRSNHLRGAQWSFGIRHEKFNSECSPGPCYYPDSKILRDGKDGTPHYSLYSRQKEAMIFSNPGPGAYTPENSPNRYNIDPMLGKTVRSQKQSAPAYSLSSRTKLFGAAEVHMNSQSAPQYSFGIRHSQYKGEFITDADLDQ
ncbi:unnamed protein product [Schistosoma mattheei]|uniref:Uncharacterized protein n=2 Tax=Schistosoma TaxID=6181 RepID=A0A183N2W0_9TREM|nr:unnamed protein product [Schistosoma margrebowiei]VDP64927.1 unnamed protein product [Schistosoma mattheei]